ncbi:hypothetical protein [Chitinophaga silvisoli]|uniref:Uncharacterized protein n=1 Tax=Chitinophaga silvisoli TaxID=2291814 RepID=A0A3E1P4B7_9BACT|nr:hypothetical protein [Chitinophaga silvisoli]RFM35043.1 hypothetical protein DXN04_06485 [Chitinophaga silvisoli]
MPNPKRRGKRTHGMYPGFIRRHRHDSAWPYRTLSEVEDINDRNFLAAIARAAAANAINENKAMNIPVTVIEDGWVVKKSIDGTVVKIAPVDRKPATVRTRVLTKGVVLHVKGH